MTKAFASTADEADRTISFEEMAPGCFAFTAEGDPNTGVIVGDDAVLVFDAQATPLMAQRVIERVRSVTDKPIRYVVLSHYHAVRTLGASAYGADAILASDLTRRLIAERGDADRASEIGRFPRLFRGADTIPGLTWPTLTFTSAVSVWLGSREVRLMHLGRAHTKGDILAWVPDAGVMFAGDTVEHGSACYCGDAHLADWPNTLTRIATFKPKALLPGRGKALRGPEVGEAIATTRAFVTRLFQSAKEAVAAGETLGEANRRARAAMDREFGGFAIYDHTMPFNIARAFDEASGVEQPRIWTAERDREVWDALESQAPRDGSGEAAAPADAALRPAELSTVPAAPPVEPPLPDREVALAPSVAPTFAPVQSPPPIPEAVEENEPPAPARQPGRVPDQAEYDGEDDISAAIAAATASLVATADRGVADHEGTNEARAEPAPGGGFAAWSERIEDEPRESAPVPTPDGQSASDERRTAEAPDEAPPFSIDFDQLEEELRAITEDRRR